MNKDSLGDRMKRYESVTHRIATPRTPLIVRVDGRAFHTLTRGMIKPFSNNFINAMVASAINLAGEMQGCKAAYVQSDEATFCLTDYDALDTQGWFGYDLAKVISISAATMSVYFNTLLRTNSLAVFDSRAFSLPVDEVVNCFLWRAKDWHRNSVQMYARSHFSHKQLMNKSLPEVHDMLGSLGVDWGRDLSPKEKNGTFILNTPSGLIVDSTVRPTYEAINAELGPLIAYP